MKRLLNLFLSCVFFSTIIQAQDNTELMATGSLAPWNPQEEGKKVEAYTAVTDGNVRDKANATATAIAKLPIGTKVTIESYAKDSATINGFTAPWCKVTYNLGGKNQSGFIWGGILASVYYEVKDDYDENRKGLIYVAGVSAVDKKTEKWTLHIRAARNGQELAKTELTMNADVGYYVQLKNLGSLGFKNVLDAIEYYCYYPACGYASRNNLVLFTGKKLLPVLETTSISDSGVYYDSQDYLLPSEKGGIQDHVVVVGSSAEMEEKEVKKGEYDMVMKKQNFSIQVYKWTGDKLMKVKEMKN